MGVLDWLFGGSSDRDSGGGSGDNVDVTYMDDKGNSHTIFDSDGRGKHGDHGHAEVDSQGNTTYVRGAGEPRK